MLPFDNPCAFEVIVNTPVVGTYVAVVAVRVGGEAGSVIALIIILKYVPANVLLPASEVNAV